MALDKQDFHETVKGKSGIHALLLGAAALFSTNVASALDKEVDGKYEDTVALVEGQHVNYSFDEQGGGGVNPVSHELPPTDNWLKDDTERFLNAIK